jgi:outer membrane protease
LKRPFLLALVVVGISASAQSRGHSLTLGTSIGLSSGEGEEIVYKYNNSDDKLSQLLWSFEPLVYAGIDLRYNLQTPANGRGVFINGKFKFGFPGKTGQMEDRDWIDARYADFLTHYSVHDNKVENAVLIDADIGTTFTVFEKYLVKTFVSYSFVNFSWTASRGSFLYPDFDGGHGYMAAPGDVGTYKQTWNIVSPGISFYGAFNNYFDIELSLKLSALVWFSAEDGHLSRDLTITEDIFGGFYVEPGLLFSFRVNSFSTLSLSMLYKSISGTRGDGEYNQQGQPALTAKNLCGGAYSAFDVGIIAKLNIGNF